MDVALTVDPERKSLIPPLSEEERQGLEASILAKGARDQVVVWGNIIVDGYNRYDICSGNNQAKE
jgi:hypothetical protein